MTLKGRCSGGIPGLVKSSGSCFKKERQKPRWRVAVRRCLEFSRAQRWRAEPLLGFRTIRPSSARLSRATGTLVECISWDKTACARSGIFLQRLHRIEAVCIYQKLRTMSKVAMLTLCLERATAQPCHPESPRFLRCEVSGFRFSRGLIVDAREVKSWDVRVPCCFLT